MNDIERDIEKLEQEKRALEKGGLLVSKGQLRRIILAIILILTIPCCICLGGLLLSIFAETSTLFWLGVGMLTGGAVFLCIGVFFSIYSFSAPIQTYLYYKKLMKEISVCDSDDCK